ATISKYSGKEAIPLAILHGILINLSVPFFVSLFCNL
ncbi:LysO family transporter, partial [uncultured Bacteroides sp.]